jgi:hypothetical protein
MMRFHCLRKLLLLATLVEGFINVGGHKSVGGVGEGPWGNIGGIVVRLERGRAKREVGPQMGKKYRGLEHSIMVQADIRSRYA